MRKLLTVLVPSETNSEPSRLREVAIASERPGIEETFQEHTVSTGASILAIRLIVTIFMVINLEYRVLSDADCHRVRPLFSYCGLALDTISQLAAQETAR